eukprot:576743-Pelagomonas_calceolata.AAC.1
MQMQTYETDHFISEVMDFWEWKWPQSEAAMQSASTALAGEEKGGEKRKAESNWLATSLSRMKELREGLHSCTCLRGQLS